MRTIRKLFNSMGRTFWTTKSGFLKNYKDGSEDELIKVSQNEGLLVSSLCRDGSHVPVLDIDDLMVQLIPSTTFGHFHLFLGKKMSWEQYKKLLDVLCEVGIIQNDFYEMSLKRKQSMVLAPGKEKHKVISPIRSS